MKKLALVSLTAALAFAQAPNLKSASGYLAQVQG